MSLDGYPGDRRYHYNCNFNKYATLAEGEPLYDDLAGQMRRCFPAIAFQEKQWRPEAGASFPDMDEGRDLTGIVDGYSVTLGLSNSVWRVMHQIFGVGAPPPVSYNMYIDVRAAR